jgi:hypothetical protein
LLQQSCFFLMPGTYIWKQSKLCSFMPVMTIKRSLHHKSGSFPSDHLQCLLKTLIALTKPETRKKLYYYVFIGLLILYIFWSGYGLVNCKNTDGRCWHICGWMDCCLHWDCTKIMIPYLSFLFFFCLVSS